MAITFVQCTDTAHAVECAKAGILYLQHGRVGSGEEWYLNDRDAEEVEFMHRTNRSNMWPPSEFAYAVED